MMSEVDQRGAGAVSLERWRTWSVLARLPAKSVRAVISKVPVDDHYSFTIWVCALPSRDLAGATVEW